MPDRDPDVPHRSLIKVGNSRGDQTCSWFGRPRLISNADKESAGELLKWFAADAKTEAVLLIGEIGGTEEELAADYIARRFRKPVAAFVAGQVASIGRRMGHAVL